MLTAKLKNLGPSLCRGRSSAFLLDGVDVWLSGIQVGAVMAGGAPSLVKGPLESELMLLLWHLPELTSMG